MEPDRGQIRQDDMVDRDSPSTSIPSRPWRRSVNWRRALAAGAMTMLSLGADAQEQVLTERVLSADLAPQAVQVAIGACRVRGVPGIAVVILDSHGLDKIVWVGDRVGRDTLQAAYRKARISLSGRPSSQSRRRWRSDQSGR
jgi:hypothetical protein